MPNVLNVSFDINPLFADLIGGTGLIIVAGVILDLMKQIESQLLMRHYEGFKYRSRSGVGAIGSRGILRGASSGVSASVGRTLGGERKGRR
jgi:preprotein translocase subunit SecY